MKAQNKARTAQIYNFSMLGLKTCMRSAEVEAAGASLKSKNLQDEVLHLEVAERKELQAAGEAKVFQSVTICQT